MTNDEHTTETDGTRTQTSWSAEDRTTPADRDRTTPADFEAESHVRVEERTRELEREKFDGLRKRYDAIDGVVMVGVTTTDGEVLLLGEETVVPLGGDVEPGEDWLAAACRNVEELTGQPVSVEEAKLVEYTTWRSAGGEASFRTATVHFEASLEADAPEFRAQPTPPADVEHKHYQENERPTLGWYDGVPEAVHENHVEHVELYLD